ncbi:MAG TPA: hypothetical protein VLK33_07455 [Terriglobales bacterium]|nr:hypothetical protein [Terriglobales bacterium]
MLRISLITSFFFGCTLVLAAQQQPSQKPQVKVNMLNVCTPSADEQKEIVAALGRIPKQPLFSQDFEIDRGRSTLDETPDFLQGGAQTVAPSEPSISNWVRIRREFGVQAQFSTVQYSFSADGKNMSETLTFRVRDPKDLMQVTLEDSASAVTTPAAMLGTNTPVGRIRLERFGKSSIVLARCQGSEGSPAPDQMVYEPLFQSATGIIANYRGLLGARSTVPAELSKIMAYGAGTKKPTATPVRKSSAPKK